MKVWNNRHTIRDRFLQYPYAACTVGINLQVIARVTNKQASAPYCDLYQGCFVQEPMRERRQCYLYIQISENSRCKLKGPLIDAPLITFKVITTVHGEMPLL